MTFWEIDPSKVERYKSKEVNYGFRHTFENFHIPSNFENSLLSSCSLKGLLAY